MQKQHDLTDHFLVGPAGDDARGPLSADPGYFPEAARILFDDIEHRLPEGSHQLARTDRANAADNPLAAARAEGRIGSRRKKLDPSKCREIAESVISGRKTGAEMARLYDVSAPTVSRIVAAHRAGLV